MPRRLRTVSGRYTSIAEAYVHHWAPVLIDMAAPMFRELPPLDGRIALDVGAGVGSISRILHERGARVLACDLTPAMLGFADADLMRVAADAERLPLRGGSIDIAVCTFVLQHVPSPARIFKDVARALTDGGTFATATWHSATDERGAPYDIIESVLEDANAPEDPTTIHAWHSRSDRPGKMKRYARAAGFSDARVWTEAVAHQWTPGSFLGWATAMGTYGRRFMAIADERARSQAIDQARARLEALTRDDLRWGTEVVFCLATR